ncbi:hypothetical protein IAT38_000101 [Cryptococcus sp. DSM 104549]
MSAPEATIAPTTAAPAAPAPSTAPTATGALPKPVTPADAIADGPAKALDPLVGEPTILDKARDIAKPYITKVEPYIEKAQEATKPYADKAAAKFEQIVDKIEGNNPSTSATPTSAGTLDKSIDNAAATTSGVATETGEKAKGIFEQGLSAVQSTFNQLTNTIEQRTTTESHPGLITQVTNAVHKGVEKVEGLLNEATDSTVPPTTTTTGTAGHPVQTTTNAVPHVPIVP